MLLHLVKVVLSILVALLGSLREEFTRLVVVLLQKVDITLGSLDAGILLVATAKDLKCLVVVALGDAKVSSVDSSSHDLRILVSSHLHSVVVLLRATLVATCNLVDLTYRELLGVLINEYTGLLKVEVTHLIDNLVVVTTLTGVYVLQEVLIDSGRHQRLQCPVLAIERHIRLVDDSQNLLFALDIRGLYLLTQACPVLTTAHGVDISTLDTCLLGYPVRQRVSTVFRKSLVVLLGILRRCPTLDSDILDSKILVVIDLRDRLKDTSELSGVVLILLDDIVLIYIEVDISRVRLITDLDRFGIRLDKRPYIGRLVDFVAETTDNLLALTVKLTTSTLTGTQSDLTTTHPLLESESVGIGDNLLATSLLLGTLHSTLSSKGVLRLSLVVVTQVVEICTATHKLDARHLELLDIVGDNGNKHQSVVATNRNIGNIDIHRHGNLAISAVYNEVLNLATLSIEELLSRERRHGEKRHIYKYRYKSFHRAEFLE